MELIPTNTRIDFVGQIRSCALVSAALVGLSLLGIAFMGFNLGIDFRGGTQLQILVPESAGEVDDGRIRASLDRLGFGDAEVTRLGELDAREFLVRLPASEEEAGGAGEARAAEVPAAGSAEKPAAPVPGEETKDSSGAAVDDPDGPEEPSPDAAVAPDAAQASDAEAAPAEDYPGLAGEIQKGLSEDLGAQVSFNSIESIGPRVGREITISAMWSLLLTSVLILAYIWFRFDVGYAPGAVVAVLHDVIITAGVFAWFQLDFDQNIIAALLVILGYSINDTVVIYDRIRENVALRGKTLLRDVVNESLNQTLSRTILTTSFTLTVVIGLLVFGGPVLRGFSLALLVGMLSGVYSTVYVASAMLIWIESRRGRRDAARAA
jgi:preprotein translocase subunit SecF